jgi:hypothetical protein
MVRSRLGLKALGLCALVLGLMAFASSAAQAETGATWRLNGANVPNGADLLPKLEILEIENNSASLSFTTGGGTGVLILCTAAKFVEGGILLAQGSISLGKVLFTGCVVLLNEKLAGACTAHSPTKGEKSGEILSERGTGLIVLDKVSLPEKEGKVEVHTYDLVKLTPENAKSETTKLFGVIELGEECSIGESVNVESTTLGEGLWIKDINGNTGFLNEATTHLIVEGLNKLVALGQPATIIGSANVGLEGAHKTLTWSGKPN